MKSLVESAPEFSTEATPVFPTESPILQVDNLTKVYTLGGNPLTVLRGITLSVKVGDFVALMGPSGSGKSTLLNILGCLDRPTSGSYYLGSEDVSIMSDDQLSDIRCRYLGFIFQQYNLLPQYTVVENIEVPLIYQGVKIDEKTKSRCESLASLVGLGDRLDHRPMQLSGGQQQRVAIARSLANAPSLILADEPTGNLDSSTSIEIMSLLRILNSMGKTIVMVTHENDIAAWSKRILRMRDGQIESDTPNVPIPIPAGLRLIDPNVLINIVGEIGEI
ncbi:MAG: ABC transporter ATP-binding protein [Gemmataceae bacterium]|nr:ABC transporter ATP-binding protein [Gemmataceae bacterium]